MTTTPSVSPPRTPDDNHNLFAKPRTTSTSPSSDDSSIIEDLSFEYIETENGDVIRLSKGSSKSTYSSPPTPQDVPLQADLQEHLKPPLPIPSTSPSGRNGLSRSESAFPIITSTSSSAIAERPARSFHRVASGPAAMAAAHAVTSLSSKLRPVPRRITLEDNRDRDDIPHSSVRARQTLDSHLLPEEKENFSETDDHPHALPALSKRHSPPLTSRSISSSRALPNRVAYSLSGGNNPVGTRPLADVPVPQRTSHARQILPGPNRAGRIMKSTPLPKYPPHVSNGANGFDRISETEGSENEYNHGGDSHSPLGIAIGGEDTEPEDEPLNDVEPASIPLPSSIPSQIGIARQRTQPSLNVNINMNGAVPAPDVLSKSGSTRPRRSASLSDALARDDYQMQVQQPYQGSNSRPGTSLGLNGQDNSNAAAGPRRIPVQEREKLQMDVRTELKKYEYDFEDAKRREQENLYQQYPTRQSPSPTHIQQSHNASQSTQRTLYGHKRRDSDTLRTHVPPLSATALGSPTLMEMAPSRSSPPNSRGRVSPPSTKGRISPPTAKGRISPPSAKERLSPSTAGLLGRESAKHRRSPTAPEAPTTSGLIGGSRSTSAGKTWAAGERDDEYEYGASASERERERERDRDLERERERRGHHPLVQTQQQHQQYMPQAPSAPATAPAPPPAQLNRHIVVNKKAYARLDMIGKGGSSRVFRVLNHANELYAIKRVSLDKTDSETMNGYMNEIALLKRLEGNSRIIRLIDSEVKAGPGGSKGHLLLVMECGEIDLARLLQEQMKEPMNMVWVSYYWQQMLQAVHVIHEEKIVHSDLKPANFVLVRGQLKLIDFGIANAIANDTTNIQRDHQVGTVNYMSPEAIELPDGMRRLKVGRPSDVWSLGCILYQMVYGHPPFQHLKMYQKMKAIPDASYTIEFPEWSTPSVPAPRTSSDSSNGFIAEPPTKLDHLKRRVRRDVIRSMKSCLARNPKERATIPQLMEDDWLSMKEPEPPAMKEMLAPDETVINPYYMRQLLEYGIKLGEAQNGAMDSESLLREAERLVAELKSIQP